MCSLIPESLDIGVSRACEKKDLIKVPLPNGVGLAPGKAAILDELSGRKGAEGHHRDARPL